MRAGIIGGARLALSRRIIMPSFLGRQSLAQLGARPYSDEPKTKAAAIIDSLPNNSFVSKTGVLATSMAAGVYALSNSLYVVNDETIMLVVFGAFLGLMTRTVAPAYKSWAQGHIDNIKGVLDAARQSHSVAVKERIEVVSKFQGVSELTAKLFEVSKETARLECQAFEAQQKAQFSTEAKSVLDSWVRYESQVRQREQQVLAQSVIANVQKELADPKFRQQLLQQAVTDVEALFKGA